MKITFLEDYHGFLAGQIFEFPEEGPIVLVGDNGAGKSTLLKILYLTHPANKPHWNIAHDLSHTVKVETERTFYYFDSEKSSGRGAGHLEDGLPGGMHLQLQSMWMSKGQSHLSYMNEAIRDWKEKNKGSYLILDEPDVGLSPFQAHRFVHFIQGAKILVMAVHSPIFIQAFPKVFQVKLDDDLKRSVIELSSEEFLANEKAEAELFFKKLKKEKK